MKAGWAKFTAAIAALALLGALTAVAQAEITQKGVVRLTVSSKISPKALPRKGAAPISVSIGWNVATTDGSAPPKLHKLRIAINRAGHFNPTGLPVCKESKIQPGSTAHALSACRSALVGKGSFNATVALAGQEPYDTSGRMVVFNSTLHHQPVLLGHIYSSRPFANSFVIVFKLKRIKHGTYGTAMTATLPGSLSAWGNLTGIDMKLSRRFHYKGKARSYISAGCPAPKGIRVASFRLAQTTFSFSGGAALGSTVLGTCRARG